MFSKKLWFDEGEVGRIIFFRRNFLKTEKFWKEKNIFTSKSYQPTVFLLEQRSKNNSAKS